jgi:hypothetical protein
MLSYVTKRDSLSRMPIGQTGGDSKTTEPYIYASGEAVLLSYVGKRDSLRCIVVG